MSADPVAELSAEADRTANAPVSRASAQRRRRLRYLYFGLASGWGFVAGSVAVLAALDSLGLAVPLGRGLGATLAVAGVVALVGGIVVSLAYREAVRRG